MNENAGKQQKSITDKINEIHVLSGEIEGLSRTVRDKIYGNEPCGKDENAKNSDGIANVVSTSISTLKSAIEILARIDKEL